MNTNFNSNDSDSSEDEHPSVSDLLLRFEKFSIANLPKSKSKSLNRLVTSSSSDTNNIRSKDIVKRSISYNNQNNLVEAKEKNEHLSNNTFKKPPVPQRSISMMVLPPSPSRRKLGKYINNEKLDFAPILPARPSKPQNDPAEQFYEILEPNNSSSLPCIRIRPRIVPSADVSTSCSGLSEDQSKFFKEFPLIQEIPPRSSSGHTNITRESSDDDVINNYMNVWTSQMRTVTNIPELPPKGSNIRRANSKEAIKRPQFLSEMLKTTTVHNEDYSKERSKHIMPSLSNDDSPAVSNSIENLTAPPLPPKSAAIRQLLSSSASSSPSSSETTNLSDLDAVGKLIQLKSIFSITNAGKSDKYNKSILLLIDIMMEAIQEGSADDEESGSVCESIAWYNNIKDFVHTETTDYINKNQLNDINWNLPYDKLFNTMVPKFIETYVETEVDSKQKSQSNEDNYEKVVNPEFQYEHTPEKILKMMDEIKQTETSYFSHLESCINEFAQQEAFSGMISILKNILIKQLEFNKKLDEKDDDVVWLLNTYLNFRDLFELYVQYFYNRIKIGKNESLLPEKPNMKNLEHLSALILNRVSVYTFFVKNLIGDPTIKEQERQKAIEVIKMLNMTLEKCNNVVVTTSISNNIHENNLGDQIDENQGIETHKFDIFELLTKVLPVSHDWTEYGSLLLKNKFKINNSRSQFTVFLFENMILVTKELSQQDFVYKYNLNLNQLILMPKGKNRKVLKLKDYFKSKSSNTNVIIKLEADTQETEKIWRREINNCLWEQLKYQKEHKQKLLQEEKKTTLI